jgi:hypothetical protein
MPRRAFSRAASGSEIILTGVLAGRTEHPTGRSEMDYNHVMLRAGEILDAAGVAVIVIGAVINTGNAAVRLAHHETRTYQRYRQETTPQAPWPGLTHVSRVADET